jgi:alkylated DNA repair dioxygenase AlkB
MEGRTMMTSRAGELPGVRLWNLDDGGALALHEHWLAPASAAQILGALLDEIDWEQRSIRIMGREVLQPRLTAWYGDAAYTYSGVTLTPLPWTPLLSELRDRLIGDVGECLNSVLCNMYRTGADSMGLHSDNEKELGAHPVIASVSLGAARRFVLRHKKKKVPPVSVELTHGSLLVMGGTTQAFWKHAVPKDPRTTGPRINLTFRRIIGHSTARSRVFPEAASPRWR